MKSSEESNNKLSRLSSQHYYTIRIKKYLSRNSPHLRPKIGAVEIVFEI
jgi:hypothetical protein